MTRSPGIAPGAREGQSPGTAWAHRGPQPRDSPGTPSRDSEFGEGRYRSPGRRGCAGAGAGPEPPFPVPFRPLPMPVRTRRDGAAASSRRSGPGCADRRPLTLGPLQTCAWVPAACATPVGAGRPRTAPPAPGRPARADTGCWTEGELERGEKDGEREGLEGTTGGAAWRAHGRDTVTHRWCLPATQWGRGSVPAVPCPGGCEQPGAGPGRGKGGAELSPPLWRGRGG